MANIRKASMISWFLLMAFALFGAQTVASASTYPSYACSSEKMAAAADRCDQVLKAWSVWTQNGTDPQPRIDLADAAFDTRWAAAEAAAAATPEKVDCVDMTLSGPAMKSLMDTAIGGVVAQVNGGLNLGVQKQATCGSKLLKSSATACMKLLQAESLFIADLAADPDGAMLDEEQAKAGSQFTHQWAQTTVKDCPTTATGAGIAGMLAALSDGVVINTTISPNVPSNAFMAIRHPAGGAPGNEVSYEGDTLVPQCQNRSAYTFFAKRGTVNKLLVYYYGGGACWDTATCVSQLCTQNANPNPPGLGGSGFADFNRPNNPFKDWHVVQVPYCSCDIHLGDNAVDYPPIPPFLPGKHVEHRGHDNSKLAEKWAREHFLNPTDMFVTGSSAGSYGAIVHGVHLAGAYPATSISVMGDGGNGVVTQEWLDSSFNNWGALSNLPDIPGINDVPTLTIPGIFTAAAAHYPGANWSTYTTAFDGGGGGQTGFYNVMLNPANPLAARTNWHEASCQFNGVMRQQSFDTAAAAPANFRYYIATGTTHTGFGNPRVYADTTGGVPPLVNWVNAMINGDPSWTNVEANPFNVLFPGVCSAASSTPGGRCNLNSDCPGGTCLGSDVKPNPLRPPFQLVGSGPNADVVVSCE